MKSVIRDKNNPCVIMWSVGNESGYGTNIVKAEEWIKSYDPSHPIHYEGSARADFSKYNLYHLLLFPISNLVI